MYTVELACGHYHLLPYHPPLGVVVADARCCRGSHAVVYVELPGVAATEKDLEEPMLERLRNFDADGMDADQLMVLSAFARDLATEYERYGEVPEWISNQRETLERAIKLRMADDLAKQIKDAESFIDSLRSKEEKRKQGLDRLASLRAKALAGRA